MPSQSTTMPSLPYVNRASTIAVTVAVNVVCVLLSFGFRSAITESNFLINIFICGFLTTLIDTIFARVYIIRLRRAGQLPPAVPTSRLVCLLPKNGVLLVLLLGLFFGFASWGTNWLLIRFFEITTYTLWRIVVWQALFACALSSIVMQLVVLRMVQPDCARQGEPAQQGSIEILNPLPRFDALKRWFDTIISDFGLNLVLGLVFGGVVIVGQEVVIYPTTREAIGISALILGAIVVALMVRPVTKSIAGMRTRGELPLYEKPNVLINWLPRSYQALTLLLAVPTIIISYLVLVGIFELFDFQALNFFQYFIVRTIYVAILTKMCVSLTVARYRQPYADKQEGAA